jgi:hypothetical protein
MSAMLYDLTVFDRVSSRPSDGKGLLPADVEFVSLREIAAGPAADVRSRSFARMAFRVAAAFDPPLPPMVSVRQHVLIAQAGRTASGCRSSGPRARPASTC